MKLWCVLVSRGRDLKKQHEQRVYEREMQRITLPLSAFSNPTCELVDENTIVITAEHETTPVQEGVEGGDPLMGQQAGTPGAWAAHTVRVLRQDFDMFYVDQNTPTFLFLLPASLSNLCFLKGEGESSSLQRLELNAVSCVLFPTGFYTSEAQNR